MSKKKLKIRKPKNNKINFYDYIGPHPDSYHSSMFVPRVSQSTHWYATKGGWTQQPGMASQEEVERVGLHDCWWQGCEIAHFGSAEEYVQRRIEREVHEEWARATQDADTKKAQGGRRAKSRQKLEKRKTTRR